MHIYNFVHVQMPKKMQTTNSLPDFPGGQFPEHLLPCAAPLLAALTEAASPDAPGAASLADQICKAMAAMAATAELQDVLGLSILVN